MLLSKGQKVDVTKGRNLSVLSLRFGWTSNVPAMQIDAACFVLSERNRCEQDEDFVFYGNPSIHQGAIAHQQEANGSFQESIHIHLSKLPPTAAKLAFTVTIHEAEKHGFMMKNVAQLYVALIDPASNEELFRFNYGSDLDKETAIVAAELYRHNGEWKFNAIGSGFFGGLAALCTSFGLEVEEESAAPQQLPPPENKKVLSPIDLRKNLVQITLEKKQLSHLSARVGLVLDISGSMRHLYDDGTVQEVVERILAVACKFDDNGSLDVWVYDNEFSRLAPATEADFDNYVQKEIIRNRHIHKFGYNDEPPVMKDVIRKYTKEEVSSLPVFLVFINDGGVSKTIKKVISESAVHPIFWQFVGIGYSDFSVLKKLDTMEGRIVDNANFIHIEDIASISDETLYNLLLNEFPQWIKAATEQRILRA